jgi:hypothetical protein
VDGLTVRPDPTEEEAAAIVAAVEVLWPRGDDERGPTDRPRWRFSNRWWSKPVAARRQRPREA